MNNLANWSPKIDLRYACVMSTLVADRWREFRQKAAEACSLELISSSHRTLLLLLCMLCWQLVLCMLC